MPTYRPTSLYPHINWGSPSTTLKLEGYIGGLNGMAVGARNIIRPDRAAVRSDRVAQFTQRREVVLGHLEEAFTFTIPMVPGWKAKQIDRFLEEWGLPGKQFEFYLNRFQGAALDFEGTLKDQQGTAGTFTGTPSYVPDITFGDGLQLDAGEFLDFPTGPLNGQPSLIASEGIIVLVVRPSFAGGDGLEHCFIQVNPAGNGNLQLKKSSGNVLHIEIEDAAAGIRDAQIAAAWSANAELRIVAKWKDSASMEIWLNGVKGTGASGAGTGVLPSLPTNVNMGTNAGGNQANGLYDRLMFLTRSFDLNASMVNVLTDEYFPWWPNHFNKAELVDARVVPARPVELREFYEYTFTIRKGAA